MKTIELLGDIDSQHKLSAIAPAELPVGPVRLMVLLADEDEAGAAWAQGIARDWADDLAGQAQDIYSLEAGEPINAVR